MEKAKLSLQPSEAVVVRAAAAIYAAYIVAGRIKEGSEREWMERCVREAMSIAKITDDSALSDNELS